MKYDFVRDVREARNAEMERYEKKGYLIDNRATYVMNDKIEIEINRERYQFGIRVNINEVYFYILHDGSQIYLMIQDIYLLLWELAVKRGKTCIVELLSFYVKNNETIDFSYRGKKYTVHRLPDNIPDETVKILDSEVSISVKELILLIYLIQDKSNYFERLSESKKYIDGLIRMLSVLLLCKGVDNVLESLGWKYDKVAEHYVLKEEALVGERNKKRYYLTNAEERLILG